MNIPTKRLLLVPLGPQCSYKVMEKLGMSLVGKTQGRRNKSSNEDREELMYSLEIE